MKPTVVVVVVVVVAVVVVVLVVLIVAVVVIGTSVVKIVETSTGFSVEDNLVVVRVVTDPPSDDPPRIQ